MALKNKKKKIHLNFFYLLVYNDFLNREIKIVIARKFKFQFKTFFLERKIWKLCIRYKIYLYIDEISYKNV